ncbi:acyl-CoA thioesterase [Catenuloplanes atrovinosus]|uniref:Acyl-CoA thioester hydrolase n=1 Tax=Catenuloplanes atrovinosus TaxID=137266 RepID=A0AAE4CEA0_9ACTN|nr:thioesterase family protein [Catenuloplanes atrovinosus]MDR7279854.1 acyl-CoA thioester hydrolase [Catenuloplanes atrovinosus]
MTTPTIEYGAIAPVTIHFDDLDALGVVHNARYAVLVERAIIEWWAARGWSFSGGRPTKPDAFNVIREYTITFHVPIIGTGRVAVHFWLEKLGNTSADYRFRFVSEDGSAVYAEGRRINVCLDPATMRPSSWTEEARAVAKEITKG